MPLGTSPAATVAGLFGESLSSGKSATVYWDTLAPVRFVT